MPLLILLAGFTLGTVLLTVGFIAELGVVAVLGVLILGGSMVVGLQQAAANPAQVREPQAANAQPSTASQQPKAGTGLGFEPAVALAMVGLTLAGVLLTAGFVIEQGTVVLLGVFLMAGSIVGGLVKASNH